MKPNLDSRNYTKSLQAYSGRGLLWRKNCTALIWIQRVDVTSVLVANKNLNFQIFLLPIGREIRIVLQFYLATSQISEHFISQSVQVYHYTHTLSVTISVHSKRQCQSITESRIWQMRCEISMSSIELEFLKIFLLKSISWIIADEFNTMRGMRKRFLVLRFGTARLKTAVFDSVRFSENRHAVRLNLVFQALTRLLMYLVDSHSLTIRLFLCVRRNDNSTSSLFMAKVKKYTMWPLCMTQTAIQIILLFISLALRVRE